MAGTWQPKVGDDVVDYRVSSRHGELDRCSEVVKVKTVTQTLVITTDGEKYNREHLCPTSEGRYSSRRLVPARDDRVLCVKGREHLANVANVARNLADLPRKDPADITAALARLVVFANDARVTYANLLAGRLAIAPAPTEEN